MTNCTWIGAGEGCANQSLEGKSYCEHHYPRVYQVGSSVRRKKDTRRYDQITQVISLFNEAVEELEAEGWTPEWAGELA